MSKINWGRVIAGGVIAAIICFITDGLLHERVVGTDWKAVYDNLRIANPEHGAIGVLYFAVFELGRGLGSIFLYALMRSHFGPGPKTAALAGVVAWLAFSVTGPAQFIPLGFFSNALWIKVGAVQLVTSILATIAGAALYKDANTPAASPASA
jgi:hypothetical protein